MKLYIHNWQKQVWSIYQILLVLFDDFHLFMVLFSDLNKQDTERKSEDATEGDPEENTAGEQPWQERKDKY